MHNPVVRPVQNRVSSLKDVFAHASYLVEYSSFMVSLKSPRLPEVTVNDNIIAEWDPCWVKVNEKFERELKSSGWSELRGKMFYVWDGNHRLRAWMEEIKTSKSLVHPKILCLTGFSFNAN